MENQRYKRSNNPARINYPILTFSLLIFYFFFYYAADSNADMLYLKNGDIVEGKILAKDEKNIVLDIFSIKVYKTKGTLIRKILQKKPGRENRNGFKIKKKFGKIFLKDKTVLIGFIRQTAKGDVLLYGHNYLPDGYHIKVKDIKKVITFQKAVIQRSKRTTAIGFLTKENREYFYLENIIQPASPVKYRRSNIKKIEYPPRKEKEDDNKTLGKLSKKASSANISSKSNVKRKGFSFLGNGNIALASGYFQSFGPLKAKLPSGIGMFVTYDISFVQLLSFGRKDSPHNFRIPGLRFESGYQKFSPGKPFSKSHIELSSFLVGSGPTWNIPFFHFDSMKIIFAITAGISYEKIYFHGQEIASAEFMLSSVLGLGYQAGRYGIFTQMRFGYSYDAKAPLYALGLNLGVAYRLSTTPYGGGGL